MYNYNLNVLFDLFRSLKSIKFMRKSLIQQRDKKKIQTSLTKHARVICDHLSLYLEI